jgi:L-threonine kinase
MKGLTGWARCPGTCGEWVQGAKDGVPFLIGCPVDRFVEAVAFQFPSLEQQINRDYPFESIKNWGLPKDKEKTRTVLEKLLKANNFPSSQVKIQLISELPSGKGMASSTADMVAAMVAVSELLSIPWEASSLAQLALEVEPTDPVMFSGITEFAHRDGSYVKSLGPVIPANFLMLDWGGSIDTQSFNAKSGLSVHYRRNELKIKEALLLFYEGMEKGNLEKIAQASTLSAQCNQEINPKPEFENFLSWVVQNGGLGVVTAHSGTILAGIFSAQTSLSSLNTLQAEAAMRFQAEKVEWVEANSGGVQGGVKYARRKSIGSEGTIRKEFVY